MTLGSGLGGREAERETGWADVRRVSPYAALSPSPSAPPASPYAPSPSSLMSSSSLSPYAFLIFVSARGVLEFIRAVYLSFHLERIYLLPMDHPLLRAAIRSLLGEMSHYAPVKGATAAEFPHLAAGHASSLEEALSAVVERCKDESCFPFV